MKVKKVRVIFNDDGPAMFRQGGKTIEFGDLRDGAEDVAAALREDGYETRVTGLTEDGLDGFVSEVTSGSDDIVFNLCEGAFGRSSFEMNVAAMLELYGIRFTGSGPLTLGVALNKAWTKDILKGAGIPTAGYAVVGEVPVELPENLRFPLIVKPLAEDASLGIETDSVVENVAEVSSRVAVILDKYRQSALVEEYVDGREFNVSVMGNGEETRGLAPSEIDFSDYPAGLPRICSYEAKWIETSPLYLKSPPVCPADVPRALERRLQAIAVAAYRALMCRDYARVDMRLGADGKLKVLEVNPNPDISRNAGFAMAASNAGMAYARLMGEIVESAARRYGKAGG
ncbi:MAG: D-alanine--D-alanine ligase [Deltaproteobacteria bacterium]|nr:D-alanine--D-alanine ligase [Deltaproteobacteria bacterium]